jgi:ankyrin repeat protein
LAAFLGRIQILRYFLESEMIEVDLPTEDCGITPLSAACIAGNFEAVELLTDHGADPNYIGKRGETPLSFCFSRMQETENQFENKIICSKIVL